MRYEQRKFATANILPIQANQADCTRWPNMNLPHDQLRGLLEVPANSTSSSSPIQPAASATSSLIFDLASVAPLSPELNTEFGFCNDALVAPNRTVCCDTTTGQWLPAPVQRDGLVNATTLNPACPKASPGIGGSGSINVRRWQ